jgi:hypothetical protein
VLLLRGFNHYLFAVLSEEPFALLTPLLLGELLLAGLLSLHELLDDVTERLPHAKRTERLDRPSGRDIVIAVTVGVTDRAVLDVLHLTASGGRGANLEGQEVVDEVTDVVTEGSELAVHLEGDSLAGDGVEGESVHDVTWEALSPGEGIGRDVGAVERNSRRPVERGLVDHVVRAKRVLAVALLLVRDVALELAVGREVALSDVDSVLSPVKDLNGGNRREQQQERNR